MFSTGICKHIALIANVSLVYCLAVMNEGRGVIKPFSLSIFNKNESRFVQRSIKMEGVVR